MPSAIVIEPQTGLRESDLAELRAALAQYPEVESAVLFGSRATGNWRPGSDVDICLFGPISRERALLLHDFLEEETRMPYFFDVLVWDRITGPALRDHIQRVQWPLYQRS